MTTFKSVNSAAAAAPPTELEGAPMAELGSLPAKASWAPATGCAHPSLEGTSKRSTLAADAAVFAASRAVPGALSPDVAPSTLVAASGGGATTRGGSNRGGTTWGETATWDDAGEAATAGDSTSGATIFAGVAGWATAFSAQGPVSTSLACLRTSADDRTGGPYGEKRSVPEMPAHLPSDVSAKWMATGLARPTSACPFKFSTKNFASSKLPMRMRQAAPSASESRDTIFLHASILPPYAPNIICKTSSVMSPGNPTM
mmetsp:Transcript_33713/g.93312  ORF Transcript_33713/g.93312 Transcript_33713/m.93312 type:complete len:258 (+) Transcript_33713:399-1172(+)